MTDAAPKSPVTIPWIFGQTYEHLLLVHWPLPAEQLRPLLPPRVDVASFEGTAWIGHDVYIGAEPRVLRLPPLPGPFNRPVITLRTIVTVGGVAGIYLLSLDAPTPFAAWFERHFLNLRSQAADVRIAVEGDAIGVRSRRPEGGADLRATYRPIGPETPPRPGTRDHFLLGGDRMYTSDSSGALSVIEVEHGPWSLAPAEVKFDDDEIPGALGLPGPGAVVTAVYQRSQQAYVAAPRDLG